MKVINILAVSCALTLAVPMPSGAQTTTNEEAAAKAAKAYMPGVSGFGTIKADSVEISPKQRTVTVNYNKAASYLPLTAEGVAALKADVLKELGAEYNGYKVKLFSAGKSLDDIALYTQKKLKGPKEKEAFVVRKDRQAAPAGLDDANIALWQSHGWYFEPKLNRWEWQRARIFQTVEDLYTQSYVIPFLMPMLENAGAYVMSPRERDTQRVEIIADNDGGQFAAGRFSTTGSWTDAAKAAFAYSKATLENGDHPFEVGTALKSNLSGNKEATAIAQWKAAVPADGKYAVYVSYVSLPNSTTAAEYTVKAADGDHIFTINQKMGGGTWIYLGHFPFKKSDDFKPIVELTNAGKNRKAVVTADAVKFGGGMGNVARKVKDGADAIDYEYVTSGYPRFTEGARYFLQWAGAPDSVFTPSDYVNDYTDDYRSRGLWVNWLAGGSSMLPDSEGLGIPIDLSFAFHSDAGTTMNDSIIGTLGIYCTAGDKLGNGSTRQASRDFTNDVMTNIVEDVRATFEPNWTRRGMWDESYFEARVPQVPAMLLELLSHQNLADMSYGLDPAFRFVVSRAIYKGMLKFLARRDNRSYTVQPLPVKSFAISASGAANYTLTWQATTDKTEPTAMPSYYIIEERIADGEFVPVAKVTEPTFGIAVDDNKIHSYRIIAGNDGGVAFPSEVLALCNMGADKPCVTIVNGFTRVSAPDRFDSGDIAGFYDMRDHGVPYIEDISYIGSMFEFRRNIPWMDDDAAGFGASRANYEDKVVAGNTFDYVVTHGEAIRKAGFSFISSSVEAFCNASDKPALVDLILGKQKEIKQGRGAYGTRFKAFPSELQSRIAALTAQGTSFFVSGAFVATDIWDNPNSTEEVAEADKKFARDVLGYNWRVGQATVEGAAYQVQTRFRDFTKGNYDFVSELSSECYAVESPDSFYPADTAKGATFMRYTENNLVAGTVFDNGNYRTAVIGFPFETIKDADSRAHLMKQILDFFTDPSPVNKK